VGFVTNILWNIAKHTAIFLRNPSRIPQTNGVGFGAKMSEAFQFRQAIFLRNPSRIPQKNGVAFGGKISEAFQFRQTIFSEES